MKLRSLIFFYFVSITNSLCQSSSLVLLPAMLDEASDEMVISDKEGWIFKKGNNASWAAKDIDLSGWMKRNPQQIETDLINEQGKLEGWFRSKLLIDSTFSKKVTGIRIDTWAAMDFYLDGNWIFSLGNTGQNGKPYQEHKRKILLDEIPLGLELGEHWIAIHVVDYPSPLFLNHLKSEFPGSTAIRLVGARNHSYLVDLFHEVTIYTTLCISVGATISLLFWIMVLVTSFEKRLILIASCVTCLTLALLFTTYSKSTLGISFEASMILYHATNLALGGNFILTAIIVATTVRRQISKWLVAILALMVILGLAENLFPGTIGPTGAILLMLICAYYTITSWKSLNGAQWAIVAGLLATAVSIVAYVIGYLHYHQPLYPLSYLYVTGVSLSFPLSLLIYLAIRFKENINDIQTKSQQVIQLLEEKKEQAVTQQKVLEIEVARQTVELRTSFENLKSTQSQLIQSEKMASLGELTAGIAHEIQNPLNFVNNFSEVNMELIAEATQEIDKGNISDVKTILDDIKENEKKINHHGKRADSIVKGMLQHSRSSSGLKEPTDINALADEYLRLAYHGLRAKDKSFNATTKTEFDDRVGKVHVIPQDIGRVILNLITNAFYAVTEKSKTQSDKYEPSVTVETKRVEGKVIIAVKDNGIGISQKVVDKIFQPFFTTKPTGQGTGLGLSLSYDIVKVHGGELKVVTKEGEGSTFSINLPS